jgi:hypothetical protein
MPPYTLRTKVCCHACFVTDSSPNEDGMFSTRISWLDLLAVSSPVFTSLLWLTLLRFFSVFFECLDHASNRGRVALSFVLPVMIVHDVLLLLPRGFVFHS